MDTGGDTDYSSSFNKAQFYINERVVLVALISLSLFAFFITLLHIFARLLIRRRRESVHRLRIISNLHQIPPPPPPESGLDKTAILALPMFVLKRGDGVSEETSSTAAAECTICLNAFESGQTARNLPNCDHIFHVNCIDAWLRSNITCPICRTPVAQQVRNITNISTR